MRKRTDLLRVVGANLRALREARNLTQEQVGERAGFSAKYVSEIERGHRDPPLGTMFLIATKGLSCSLAELVATAPQPARRDPSRTADDLPRSIRRMAEGVAKLPSEKLQRRVISLVGELVALYRSGGRTES